MQLILQNLIGGLQMGSIYALIALGYTMVYGIVKLINFAHGDVMMVGAYAVFWVMTTTLVSSFAESNPVLAIVFAVVFAIAFCVALGEGKAPEEAIRFANVAAGLAVTKYGVVESIPTREEIDAYISKL